MARAHIVDADRLRREQMRYQLTMLAASGALLLGCASYEPTETSAVPKPELTLHGSGDHAVGAAPIVSTEDQERYFDANFRESGIVAVNVEVANRGERPVLVRATDVRLIPPNGRMVMPSSASQVASKVGEDGSVIGAAIAFGIIGAMVAQDAEDEAQAARRADYEQKSLGSDDVLPGGSKQGLVYFVPAKGTPAFDTAELQVRFIDRMTGASELVTVPLSGIGYTPEEDD